MPEQPSSGSARAVAAIDALSRALADSAAALYELNAAADAMGCPDRGAIGIIDQADALVRERRADLDRLRERFAGEDGQLHD